MVLNVMCYFFLRHGVEYINTAEPSSLHSIKTSMFE